MPSRTPHSISRAWTAGFLLCSLVPSGCATAGSRIAPATTPATRSLALHGKPVAATLRIKVPRRKKHREHYISPATASATIDITATATCKGCSSAIHLAIGLTPGSTGCTPATSGTICSLPFSLNPGTYSGVIATYDGPLSIGHVTGNELSANGGFPVTIVAGAANQIGATLDGIPASTEYALLSAPPGSIKITNGPFRLTGMGQKARLAIFPIDADGYAIAGPGAPSLSVVMSAANGFTAATAPGSNVVALTTPARSVWETNNNDTMSYTFSGPGCAPQICSGSVQLQTEQIVAVVDQSDHDVGVFSASGVPIGEEEAGLQGPCSAAFDQEGDLLVADPFQNAIFEYAWPYDGAPVRQITTTVVNSLGQSLATDASDNLAVLTSTGVAVYAPPYSGAPSTHTMPIGYALGFGSSGSLYVTSSDQRLTKFDKPLFTSSISSVLVGQTQLWYLNVVEEQGAVWVGARTAGKVYSYDTALNSIKTLTLGAPIDGMTALGGDMLVSQAAADKVSLAYYPWSSVQQTIGTNMSGPKAIAIDVDDNLLALQSTTDQVGIFAPDSTDVPYELTNVFNTFQSSSVDMTIWPTLH
jgi:hypothetical protein